LTLIIFFTNGRYRLPLLVILIPFAVIGAMDLFSSLRGKKRRRAGMAGAIMIAFLMIAFLPIRATDDVTAYYNTHAIILDKKGFTSEAIVYWKASSDMNRPYSAFADLSLAGKYFQRGDFQGGNFFLSKISDYSFAAASKYELLGDVMTRRNHLPEAIAAYERSLEINSGQRRILAKLIHLYRVADPPKAVLAEERLRHVASFYDLM
jgi:tetratricopeptide (TPR) repeat protein